MAMKLRRSAQRPKPAGQHQAEDEQVEATITRRAFISDRVIEHVLLPSLVALVTAGATVWISKLLEGKHEIEVLVFRSGEEFPRMMLRKEEFTGIPHFVSISNEGS